MTIVSLTRKNFVRLCCILLIVFAVTASSRAQNTGWSLDKSYSTIRFEEKHLGIGIVPGQFMTFEVRMESKAKDFADANIDFTIKTASLSTNNAKRDDDLKSGRYYDVAKYPEITFKSRGIRKIKGGHLALSGDLVIKDITNVVEFTLDGIRSTPDPAGGTRAAFHAELILHKKDFHLEYGDASGGRARTFGPEVKLIIDAEFTRSKPAGGAEMSSVQ